MTEWIERFSGRIEVLVSKYTRTLDPGVHLFSAEFDGDTIASIKKTSFPGSRKFEGSENAPIAVFMDTMDIAEFGEDVQVDDLRKEVQTSLSKTSLSFKMRLMDRLERALMD